MDFRTEVTPAKKYPGMIDHHTPVMLIGSCFCENIGERMAREMFDVTVNPFGPLYNPGSICRALEILSSNEDYKVVDDELIRNENLYRHFMFHSRYSGRTPDEAKARMTESVSHARDVMQRVSTLVITLGTTRVFFRGNEIVANCHKLPAANFTERHLSLEECCNYLRSSVSAIRSVASECNIIFTVSPIRYVGEGAHRNTLSKATLQLAIERIMAEHENIHYFPAFEIMMDDLRDYRFYAEDMKHPSDLAVKYIYGKFAETYFSEATRAAARTGAALTARLAHRSFDGTDVSLEELQRFVPQQHRFLLNSLHR